MIKVSSCVVEIYAICALLNCYVNQSGLPMKLYKYLPREYLDSVLNDGAFLFRSLSYFQDYEDSEIRGDKFEGINKYNGKDGLEINNLSTGNLDL
ncbi:MAG: hypothetical protein CMK66_02730 [Pseudoalteromonas sp.]|nr:hypothetical protein [Pseudoalteromonas sp.]|tara:strand:+ start:2144 stop:2428 length:285 start_codon:yes stop_codon:yes gene_type:complete